jgi:hypothetical protein
MSAKTFTIADARIVDLPKVQNRAGNITSLNQHQDVPFAIERVFYLYDIPGGESRGAHAHKECHQLLIAASGSFSVSVNDGDRSEVFYLNRPYKALHIPPGLWASEIDFSSGAICLVLASHAYDESDYLRDFEDFKAFKQ